MAETDLRENILVKYFLCCLPRSGFIELFTCAVFTRRFYKPTFCCFLRTAFVNLLTSAAFRKVVLSINVPTLLSSAKLLILTIKNIKYWRCYLDIEHEMENGGSDMLGRIVIELESQKLPKICENFRALCSGRARNYYGMHYWMIIRKDTYFKLFHELWVRHLRGIICLQCIVDLVNCLVIWRTASRKTATVGR